MSGRSQFFSVGGLFSLGNNFFRGLFLASFKLGDKVCSVDNLFLTCVEGVAFRAELSRDGFGSRAGYKGIATRAGHLYICIVLWMNIVFHCKAIIAGDRGKGQMEIGVGCAVISRFQEKGEISSEIQDKDRVYKHSRCRVDSYPAGYI